MTGLRRALAFWVAALVLLPACVLHQTTPVVLPAAGGGLSVLSLNLAMREDVETIASEMAAVGLDRVDVMLLQEVAGRPGAADTATELGRRLGMAGVHRQAFALDDGRTVGLATLSRYPLSDARVLPLTRFDLNFRSRERIALAATFDTPLGLLPTYNVHLDTRINRTDRVEQVSGILNDLSAAGTRAIVAGDFNTNQHLWLFHLVPLPFLGRQGGALEALMARHGLRSAFSDGATHDALGMRLDWVFLKGLAPLSASIHPLELSDHHALVVSLAPAGVQ